MSDHPTSPDASPVPLPPPPTIPADLARAFRHDPTDRAPMAPATMDEIRALLFRILDDQAIVNERFFLKLGELTDGVDALQKGQDELQRKLDGSIEAAGRVAVRTEQLNDTIEHLTNQVLVLDFETKRRFGEAASAIAGAGKLASIRPGAEDEERRAGELGRRGGE